MTDSTDSPRTPICVLRIDHPRGDGLGRALVLDCVGGSLAILFDDPAELRDLIGELTRGLAWVTERSRDLLESYRAPTAPQADGAA
jgi:hypothetical protein